MNDMGEATKDGKGPSRPVPPDAVPQEPDLAERLRGFHEELRPLLGKYEMAIGAQAGLTPDGRVFAQPVFISDRQRLKEQAKKRPGGSATGLSEG